MVNGYEVQIVDRATGAISIRAVGAHGFEAIRRMRKVVNGLLAEAKSKAHGDDVPCGTDADDVVEND